MELTALGSAVVLALFGIINSEEMLQGFANSTVITIAALFVIGAALFETGVAENVANKLIGLTRGNVVYFSMTVIVLTAVLSGFLSNTGTVAVMIPTVIAAAKKLNKNASDFLLPMAFAASIGGMLTLIGTPPNIVIVSALTEKGFEPFSFFEFSFLGIPILVAYIVYSYFFNSKNKSDQEASEASVENDRSQLANLYDIKGKVFRLRIREGSTLISKTLQESAISDKYDVNIIAVEPVLDSSKTIILRNKNVEISSYSLPLQDDDILVGVGDIESIERMAGDLQLGIQLLEANKDLDDSPIMNEIGFAEAIVLQRSSLNGQSIKKLNFFTRYKVRVIGIMRYGKALKLNFINEPLQFGDQLLLIGAWGQINQLKKSDKNFIISGRPERLRDEGRKPLTFHSYLSVAALCSMVLLMLFNVLPMVQITIAVALFLILSGCIKIEAAYRSISWQSVILIAAMIPMSTALNKTGGAQLVADSMVSVLGGGGPYLLLAGIFLITCVFSQFISNTATTILLVPIAFKTAESLGISIYPVLMMVAAGASAAFLTPIASPVNTLVLGPGGYSFGDFVKKGTPLILVVLIISLLLIPIIWPVKI